MDLLDILRKLTYEAGVLVSADEHIFEKDSPDFIVGLALHFEQLSFYFAAQPDDDTIGVSLVAPLPATDCFVLSASYRAPWAAVNGQGCRWAWLLTNQQGYTDGVRLEFATEPEATFVEFVVTASAIRCCSFHAPA